jgi:predicted dinucleotide-binding enzyme
VACVFGVKPERKKEHEMKITTIGRGEIGGTLGRLWASAGHEVTELGHDGGDAADADVVLLAVPGTAVSEALAGVTGLQGKVILDATNRISSETPPPAGYDSVAEYVKETTGAGSVAKVFHLNYGPILDQAAAADRRPSNLWVGDEGARGAVEQLSADIGMEAAHGGPLERAAAAEAFTEIFISVYQEAGAPIFYRFATPENL